MKLQEIQSVGIELEGGYCCACFDLIYAKYKNLHIETDYDGSVYVNRSCSKHGFDQWAPDGEIKAWVAVSDLPKLFKFVQEMFSICLKQNNTCGNHVHLSFKKTTYDRFMNEKAWKDFVQFYRSTFSTRKYLARLHNEYCQSDWDKREGALCGDPDYCYEGSSKSDMITFSKYFNTTEFRILPHFRSGREAITSYSKLLMIVERMTK